MISLGSKVVHEFVENHKWNDGDTEALDLQELRDSKDVMVISMKRYDELEADSDFLNALRAAGVDNWEGYGFAHEIMEGEADE